MNIWIIEDVPANLKSLEKMVREVFADYPGKYALKINPSFVWPEGITPDEYPNLVILDIMDNETDPKGIAFYEKLRKTENSNRRAHVIVWSGYTGDARVKKFIKDWSGTARFMHVEKAEELLRSKLEGLKEKLRDLDREEKR